MTPTALRALASRVETEEPTEELRAAVLAAFGSEAEPGSEPDPLRSVDDAMLFNQPEWLSTHRAGDEGVWMTGMYRTGGQSCRSKSGGLARAWTAANLRALAWEKEHADG